MNPIHWEIDKGQSALNFKIERQLLPDINGHFTMYDMTLESSDYELSNTHFEFTIDLYSLDTNDTDHNELLKSSEFLAVDRYTQMHFRSTSFTKISGDDHVLAGDLTLAGVTRPIVFTAIFGGQTKDGYGHSRISVEFSGIINRNDFMAPRQQQLTFKLKDEMHLHADLLFAKRFQ